MLKSLLSFNPNDCLINIICILFEYLYSQKLINAIFHLVKALNQLIEIDEHTKNRFV